MLASIRPCPTNCFYWRWTIPLCLHKRKKTSKINSWTASKPTVSISKPVPLLQNKNDPAATIQATNQQQWGGKNGTNSYCHSTINGGVECPIDVATPLFFFVAHLLHWSLGVLEQNPAPPLFLALTHCCLFPSFHRHEHFLPTLRRYIGLDPGHNTVDHHGRSK